MRQEIPSLTGLRGVACLLVVITHYAAWTRTTLPGPPQPDWFRYFSASGIGMSIFFTLSGFVIALSYNHWDWRARPAFNLTRLFFYRFARLYPAFLLFCLLIIVRTPALQDFSDPDVRAYLLPHLLLVQDWLPLKFDGLLATSSRFHVSWSLSVECGLYLLFGLGAVVAMGARRPWFVGILFFVITGLLLYGAWAFRSTLKPADLSDLEWGQWLLFFSPYGVSIQFGIGVAAFRLFQTRPAGAKIISNAGAILLVMVHVMSTQVAFEIAHIYLATSIAVAAIMAGSASQSTTNRLLSSGWLVFVGTISYSLYLFHFIVPVMTTNVTHASFDAAALLDQAINSALTLALAIMLSAGIYRLVEVPGRRWIRAAADRILGLQVDASLPRSAAAE
jgi:peptidoglycan/LPS O-acetylase OafA/YrhL